MNAAETAVKPPRSRLLFAALIVGTIVAVLAVLPAFVMATMSVMVVAAGAEPLVFLYLVFAFALPVVVVLAPILAWLAYALRRERLSWGLLVSPAVWAAILFGLLFLIPGGAG